VVDKLKREVDRLRNLLMKKQGLEGDPNVH
jgi:hypothetical protein